MNANSISRSDAAVIAGASGVCYWIGLVGVAAGARIVGAETVGVAWWVGAILLFVALVRAAARAGLFSSAPQGVLTVALALVVTAVFAFWALVLMVNVLESIGIAH